MEKKKTPIDLVGMSSAELEQLAVSLGHPKFRGRQLADWIYKRGTQSIEAMSNLPGGLRDALTGSVRLCRETVLSKDVASDGTTKFLLELSDKERVESVLLPYEDRVSTCISTQVGCAAGCTFCATGMGGFSRQMTAGEIVDEVLTLQNHSQRRISHVVYMGMGEPLLNYDNVIKSIHILNQEVGIAMRHFTLSTVGITPKVDTLADENLQLTLAISLHAPDDTLRQKLIPLAAKYPLRELMNACRRYTDKTRRRITFEYLLIHEVNDSLEQARRLAKLLKGVLCNVNLIPYNEVPGVEMSRPPQPHVRAFATLLSEAGIVVTQRMERGRSISAACGQLRRRMGE